MAEEFNLDLSAQKRADVVHDLGLSIIESGRLPAEAMEIFERTGVMPLAFADDGQNFYAIMFLLDDGDPLTCEVQIFDRDNSNHAWLENGSCGTDWFSVEPRSATPQELGGDLQILGRCGVDGPLGRCEFIYGLIADGKTGILGKDSSHHPKVVNAGLCGAWVASASELDFRVRPGAV